MKNLLILAAALFVCGTVETAEARGLFASLTAAAEPMPTPDALAPVPQGCAAPVVVAPCTCCPTPCIRYRNAVLDLKRTRCCDPCAPPLKSVLCVKNPCTCCPVEVPVCLPSCCCGEPKVSCRKAAFGAGVVTYDWCCGVSVVVRFDKCGDVLVTYRGT
ncbi:MAG: hypothetical protein QM775_21560 [Pirellulales bacterium]